jgi:hypothetical protein
MNDQDDWINKVGGEFVQRQQKEADDRQRSHTEEQVRVVAHKRFWSEFRPAVEHIVEKFNERVGQSLVLISLHQEEVTALNLKAGNTVLSATIAPDGKFRVADGVVRGGQRSHEYNITYPDSGSAQIKEHPGAPRDVARKVLEPWLQKVVRKKP